MADLSPRVSNDALRDYRRLREDAAGVDLTPFACIELFGEDRIEWLQGQATNDLRTFSPGNSISFCFCEPTGGILAVIDAWALPDRIVLITARECLQLVLDRIERMTILEDVIAQESSHAGFSVQGPKASEALGALMILPNDAAGSLEGGGFALRSDRGWDLWLPSLSEELQARFPIVLPEAYEAARLEAGIPKWGSDIGPKTLPPELGADFEARHVSYSKGCYTGQEVLMRIHSRGHTNRTWVGLVSDAELEVGSPVTLGEAKVGTISSVAVSPTFGYLAAATLRNEAAQDGLRVRVGDVEAEVRSMPILRPL